MIYPEDTPLFDVPEAEYRAAEGVNVSALKHMRLSAAHFKHAKEESEPDKVNTNLIVGTLIHRARLEPSRLCYSVRPPEFDSWRTKAAQQWRDAQTLPVVTPDEEQQIIRCADALERCEQLNEACARGKTEVTMFKRHKRTGLLLKCRLDLVFDDDANFTWIDDIKSVLEGGASIDAFARRIAEYNYHQQAAFYCDIVGTDRFLFIAVEKTGFPGVGIYELTPEDLELGRRTNEALLTQLARSIETNEWPSYSTNPRQISLPAWKRKQDSADVF